jgi:hypothetical protein
VSKRGNEISNAINLKKFREWLRKYLPLKDYEVLTLSVTSVKFTFPGLILRQIATANLYVITNKQNKG